MPVQETKRNKLLIADSNKDSLIISKTYFESAGYDVITAEDAIKTFKSVYNESPDIIILESNMPLLNGYESCRLIKSDPSISGIPVILLNHKDQNQQLGLEQFTNKYLIKDFNLNYLAKTIEFILSNNNTNIQSRHGLTVKINDNHLISKISKQLDHKILETNLINTMSRFANSSGDYTEAFKNIFYVFGAMINFGSMSIFIKDENAVYIDALKPLTGEYMNWVLYKISSQCQFNYKEVSKKIVIEREYKGKGLLWDTYAPIIVKKLVSQGNYIGSIIITKTGAEDFSQSEQDTIDSMINPITTILDNMRLYRQLNQTTDKIENIRQELVACGLNIEAKIEDRTMQLQKMYEAGKVLTTIHEPDRLLATLVDMIISSISAEVGAAVLFENTNISKKIEFGLEFEVIKNIKLKDTKRTPVYEHVMQTGEAIILGEPEIKKTINLNSAKLKNLNISSLACIPFITESKVIGVMIVINKLKDDSFSKDDIVSLTTLTSMATVAIQNAKLYQQTIQKTKLEADVKMAMEMQLELLPKAPPKSDVFDVAAMYTPAELISGDYYDYIIINDNNIGFVVADVTGHGVSSAFIMTQVKACVQLSSKNILSTEDVIRSVNSFLYRHIPKNNFVSMLYAIINEEKRSLLYTSAGHNPSILYKASTGEFQNITTDGLFLSLFENTEYGEIEIPFSKGDIFVFYTDGLTEAPNVKKEFFGLNRLKDIIKKHKNNSAQEISSTIFWELQDFIGNLPLNDDLTFIVLKIKN